MDGQNLLNLKVQDISGNGKGPSEWHYDVSRIDCRTFLSFLTRNRTIFDLFFRALSPASILRVSWVCKECRSAALSYMQRAYDISKHLARYFSSPESFRKLQARTGTLISGSSALQFMDRTCYPGSDLDIYVDRRFGIEVGHWLQTNGYHYRRDTLKSQVFEVAFNEYGMEEGEIMALALRQPGPADMEPYPWRGIARVFNFYQPTAGGGEQKLQLITADLSPLTIILFFHSTCVMNVISHAAAYSLYANETFERRRSLVCETAGSAQEEARKKYINRGWSMLESESVTLFERTSDRSCIRDGLRTVGDGLSWTIPFEPISTDSTMLALAQPDPLLVNSWLLQHVTDGNGLPKAEISFYVLEAPFLRWRYAIAETMILPEILLTLENAITHWGRVSVNDTHSTRQTFYDTKLHALYGAYVELRKQQLMFVDSFPRPIDTHPMDFTLMNPCQTGII